MIEKIKEWLSKYSVVLMVGSFLLYSVYINRADDIYSYVKAWYVLDYSYGFGSRLLIGSILHLLCGEVVMDAAAYHFVVTALCLLCIAVALFAGYVYRRMEDKYTKIAVLFLIVFYIASPASPEYLWTIENMGRLDTYLFLITVLMAFVYFKVKNVYIRYLLFTIFGIAAVFIHQVYFFLFFPFLLVIMLQDIWKSGWDKRKVICAVCSVLSISGFFLYMQFGSGIYYDYETLMTRLNEHTDLPLDGAPMEAEYFWTLKDHFYKNMVPEIPHHLKYGFMLVCMLVPVWGGYLWAWLHAIGHSHKRQKIKYILMLCTNLAYLPVFMLMNDWGRWFAALFIVGFLDIMLLAGDEDEGMCHALRNLGEAITCNPMPFILAILYVVTFEKFEGLNFPEQVTDFYYTTYNIKNWLLHH
ncbi:MAG: hypothetical protein K2L82_00825 [Lachnospiraceae bacterium]|nr:hypothetical protein [Lachnospiraceae bacterium]